VLCVTASPFVKSIIDGETSRRLRRGEGYPAASVIEMWRPNTREWAAAGVRSCSGRFWVGR
jgi:hypothetical protein